VSEDFSFNLMSFKLPAPRYVEKKPHVPVHLWSLFNDDNNVLLLTISK